MGKTPEKVYEPELIANLPGLTPSSVSMGRPHGILSIIAIIIGLVIFVPSLIFATGLLIEAGFGTYYAFLTASPPLSLLVLYPAILRPLIRNYRTEYRIFSDRIEFVTGALFLSVKEIRTEEIESINVHYPNSLKKKCEEGDIEIKGHNSKSFTLHGLENPESKVSEIKEIVES